MYSIISTSLTMLLQHNDVFHQHIFEVPVQTAHIFCTIIPPNLQVTVQGEEEKAAQTVWLHMNHRCYSDWHFFLCWLMYDYTGTLITHWKYIFKFLVSTIVMLRYTIESYFNIKVWVMLQMKHCSQFRSILGLTKALKALLSSSNYVWSVECSRFHSQLWNRSKQHCPFFQQPNVALTCTSVSSNIEHHTFYSLIME